MDIEADLFPKGTVISGLRGSGKTYLARHIAKLHPGEVLIYDPLGEFVDFDRLEPKKHSFPDTADEFVRLLDRVPIMKATEHPYRLLIVDEAQLVVPSGRRLHPKIARLNTIHRHIPLGIIWIAQRPRFLHANINNLADHMMLFRLPGATDSRYLEDVARGLADEVRELGEYEFVYVNKDRRYFRIPPVREEGLTTEA